MQHLDGRTIWCEHRGGASGPIGQSREALVLVPPDREVATRLFMSPRTVEATLARAYRKLGVSSRAELGAKIAEP